MRLLPDFILPPMNARIYHTVFLDNYTPETIDAWLFDKKRNPSVRELPNMELP
jgi:hypothetical protein